MTYCVIDQYHACTPYVNTVLVLRYIRRQLFVFYSYLAKQQSKLFPYDRILKYIIQYSPSYYTI